MKVFATALWRRKCDECGGTIDAGQPFDCADAMLRGTIRMFYRCVPCAGLWAYAWDVVNRDNLPEEHWPEPGMVVEWLSGHAPGPMLKNIDPHSTKCFMARKGLTMEDKKPRRSPQPSIDPALVVPGSRWQKNRAEDIGREPIFVIVDSVDVFASTGEVDHDHIVVRYHNERTLRRGKMPLDAFCSGSEHRLPEPEPEPRPQPVVERVEEAPPSGERASEHRDLAEEVATLNRRTAAMADTLAEILALLKRPGQLTLAVPR